MTCGPNGLLWVLGKPIQVHDRGFNFVLHQSRMYLIFLVYVCKITWEANIATENRYQETIFILLDIYFLKFFSPFALYLFSIHFTIFLALHNACIETHYITLNVISILKKITTLLQKKLFYLKQQAIHLQHRRSNEVQMFSR